MNYEYDIFISYGSSDDDEGSALSQWAAKFCEYLSVVLKRITKRDLTFLLHDDLRARKQLLGTESPVVLTNTAIFVTLLSPEYAGSESYQRELKEVYNAVYQGTNNTSRYVNRIFKVLTMPMAENQQPDCLVNELGYDFFEINRYTKKSKTLEIPEEDLTGEKFWSKLIDLAYDINASLELLSGKDNQVKESKKYVYLAEVSFDQTESRDEIKRELQHLGYNILPLIKLPDDKEQAEALVSNYLDRSVLSVHLMGAFYGDFVKNAKNSMIDLQNIIARSKISVSGSRLKRLIWIPSDLKTTDQRQSLYLNRLKRDESSAGTEIVEAPIEVFKSVLRTKIDEIEKPVKEISPNSKVYVIFENGNRNELARFYDILAQNNIDIIEPEFSDQHTGIITMHKQNLVVADAVLIYKGNSSNLWFNAKVQDLVKAPGFGKEKPYNVIGLVTADNIDENVLKFIHDTAIQKSEWLDEAFCLSFVNNLKQEEDDR
ncbi:MAG: hypothetical protein JXB00_17595 [Bacteroidales bacterium]|nr:hypothetical protein [Bacteroidales bacterium]